VTTKRNTRKPKKARAKPRKAGKADNQTQVVNEKRRAAADELTSAMISLI